MVGFFRSEADMLKNGEFEYWGALPLPCGGAHCGNFSHGDQRGDNHEMHAEHLGHAFAQQCVTCALDTSPLDEKSRTGSSPQASVSQHQGEALVVPRCLWFRRNGCHLLK